jgi:DNA-3-methyladenine glycosylase
VTVAASGVAADSRRPLPRAFYARETDLVARALLGAVLECQTAEGRAAGRIVETEAYLGPSDPASHAVVGLTDRTRDLFGDPGTSYVYFIYGVHWCFNAVTWRANAGTAVLVRALEPVQGLELMRRRRGVGATKALSATASERVDRELTNGPGKLCEALGIDGQLSGRSLQRPPLVLRQGREIADADVVVSPRIGITRAAEGMHRYFVKSSEFVSRRTGPLPLATYAARESRKERVDDRTGPGIG